MSTEKEKFPPKYIEYTLKYPIKRGDKSIPKLKIEVPNGLQVLAMTKKETEMEMLAALISQCSVDDKFTENEILESLKYPDIKALNKLCDDFFS